MTSENLLEFLRHHHPNLFLCRLLSGSNSYSTEINHISKCVYILNSHANMYVGAETSFSYHFCLPLLHFGIIVFTQTVKSVKSCLMGCTNRKLLESFEDLS